MKKIIFLSLIFAAVLSTNVHAQAGDPATALQQAKEKMKPQMIEKTGLTDAQADRVIEINFEMRQQAANVLPGLNEADRATKMAELKAAKEKKYSEIPLTAEQIKTLYAYYDDMKKNMPKKSGN